MKLTPRVAAGLSITSNTLLVGGKFVAGAITGSVSIISEAIHSSMDLLAAIIAFYSVSVSSRPADADHQFGHGKIENVSGVIEAVLILVAAGLIIGEAVRRIMHGAHVGQMSLGLWIMGASVAMNFTVSRVLFFVAKKHDSVALEADGHHLSTDVFTSLGVFAGLVLVRITGKHILDPIAAIGVALLIVWVGADVLGRSFKDLLDRSLPEDELAKIRTVIDEHADMFLDYHQVRTRKSGPDKHVDLHLVFCKNISLEEAHGVCDHIEKEIVQRIGRIQITTHLEPCEDTKDCASCGWNKEAAGNK